MKSRCSDSGSEGDSTYPGGNYWRGTRRHAQKGICGHRLRDDIVKDVLIIRRVNPIPALAFSFSPAVSHGARGIFLRALGDSPFLRELLAQVASRPTEPCATLVSV